MIDEEKYTKLPLHKVLLGIPILVLRQLSEQKNAEDLNRQLAREKIYILRSIHAQTIMVWRVLTNGTNQHSEVSERKQQVDEVNATECKPALSQGISTRPLNLWSF